MFTVSIFSIYKNKYVHFFATSLLLLSLLMVPTTSHAANPSIATTETTPNVVAGTDDQTASTVVTQANVEEVKASRTLTVGALPGNTETITIGTCVITYASSTGATNDELDCADNAAAIDRDTGAGNTPRTATDIAGVMRTLTNVSDTGHGALTVSGSGANVTFTTTNTESSATAVTFTDGTGGDITSTSSTTGVVPVAQINTITIGGTVDTGDVFTATLPTVGAVTYTVTSSDTTTTNIATGLNTAIQASAGYAGQAFTSSPSTNTVVLTAKVAGTGFTQTSGATNRVAVAQAVVFTPTNIQNGYNYTITINNTNYTYNTDSDDILKTIVEGLQVLVTANSAVNCTEDDVAVTCTAISAGTTFTYSTNTSLAGGSSGGVHFGCKDQNASNYEYFSRHKQELCKYDVLQSAQSEQTIKDFIVKYRELFLTAYKAGLGVPQYVLNLLGITSDSTAGSALMEVRDLEFGMEGEDVRRLQELLITQNSGPAAIELRRIGVTSYFGVSTEYALDEYQVVNNIEPRGGYFGAITRDQMKAAGLIGLWW